MRQNLSLERNNSSEQSLLVSRRYKPRYLHEAIVIRKMNRRGYSVSVHAMYFVQLLYFILFYLEVWVIV